jgi:DNA-binding FadR family transcriptional regulator
MVLMKYFCFCFPVRLGVMITSVITLVESIAILAASLHYSADDIKRMADDLRDKSKDNNMFDKEDKEMYEILIEYVKNGELLFVLDSIKLKIIPPLQSLRQFAGFSSV